MNTFTIGDSYVMASIPMRYPDAKLAQELLFDKDKIKGRWLSGEESFKIFQDVYVENKQLNNPIVVEDLGEVNKDMKENEEEKQPKN